MKPFTLNIENDVLEGISYRLKSSRLTEDIGNSNWNYGTERNYLEELLEYWISEYDWKKTENEINSLPNFICEINDVPIHFIHIKSPNENSKPIILTPKGFIRLIKAVPILPTPTTPNVFFENLTVL